MSLQLSPIARSLLAVVLLTADAAQAIDATWHAPSKSAVNDLDGVFNSKGVYGFIYNSSTTPDGEYGVYNWCNMPHVRKTEYVKASSDYELQYVELMQRHHKRTPYSSNAFPVESYHWNCDDSALYYYGQPFDGHEAAKVYQSLYISPVNPFVQSGWIGTCRFPQITAEGLEDCWQHGSDLYGVYGDLLHLLPRRGSAEFANKVKYRVTNNVITSQVAGMVIDGTWNSAAPVPLMVQADGIDSLEPQYKCAAADNLFNSIKSSSNTPWKQHLDRAADLYHTLDDISGVPSNDNGFHMSFDHYYDNLSARQCHSKPLPCKLVDGKNSTSCVTQELADTVYRLGNWEYSQIYRDSPASLKASAASLGVWIGELTTHWRDFMAGKSSTAYFHNVAHDGSVSRLLSILQIDKMVWPGMGSEVVFELYKKKAGAPSCNHDNCLRYMIQQGDSASKFCNEVAAPTATWPSQCGGEARVASACSCLSIPTATASAKGADSGKYFVRVLFGGQVLKSSVPEFGVMNMVPIETLLEYFDKLVGKGASNVKANCQ